MTKKIFFSSLALLIAGIFFIINDAIINYLASKNIQFYHKVTEGCPKFFTLNDEYTKDDVMVEMSVFLEEFFSEPSPYEKINMVDK